MSTSNECKISSDKDTHIRMSKILKNKNLSDNSVKTSL